MKNKRKFQIALLCTLVISVALKVSDELLSTGYTNSTGIYIFPHLLIYSSFWCALYYLRRYLCEEKREKHEKMARLFLYAVPIVFVVGVILTFATDTLFSK